MLNEKLSLMNLHIFEKTALKLWEKFIDIAEKNKIKTKSSYTTFIYKGEVYSVGFASRKKTFLDKELHLEMEEYLTEKNKLDEDIKKVHLWLSNAWVFYCSSGNINIFPEALRKYLPDNGQSIPFSTQEQYFLSSTEEHQALIKKYLLLNIIQ